MLNPNSLTAKPSVGRSEYGRVKVALPPGRGLMDWVRLTTGKILAKKRQPSVSVEELMKHDKKDDCWVLIFGEVFDVTTYLEFHPGGIPELLRGAGRDATPLFNQYHAWVNYGTMLKSCYVGKFVGDVTKLPPCLPPTINEEPHALKTGSSSNATNSGDSSRSVDGIDISNDAIEITSPDWNSLRQENIVVESSPGILRILVRHFQQPAVEYRWDDVPSIISECSFAVTAQIDRFRVEFNISESLQNLLINRKVSLQRRPLIKYYKCEVESKQQVSRDCFVIIVKLPIGVWLPIPAGQHVSIKVMKKLASFYRPYTPTGFTLPKGVAGGTLEFMIKVYPKGCASPILGDLNPGDELEISDPIGDFDVISWSENGDLLLLAGGSGVTPMIPIIKKRIDSSNSTYLHLYNKQEDDIVKDNWLPFMWTSPDCQTLKIAHILSSPTTNWTGLRGRINKDQLPELTNFRIAICGPDGFIDAATRILEDCSINSQRIHIFQG